MNNYVKTNQPDFVRDTQSRAILNTNVKALEAHILQRERILKTNKLFDEVEELKSDISHMKSLLIKIADKLWAS